MEVAVGQQHQDALFDPYSKATIHPVKNNEVHSGCGGTFVSHIVCKEDVSKKSDRSAVRKLLIVAGGAGYGPDVEYSHASLTEYAKGNRIRRSGGLPIISETETPGAGYDSRGVWVKNPDRVKKRIESGLHGACGRYRDANFYGGFGGGGALQTEQNINGTVSNINGCGGGYTGGGHSRHIIGLNNITGGGGGSFSIDQSGSKRLGNNGPGKCPIRLLS